MLGLQLALVVLLGAVGTGGAERDQADAYLSGGHDQATQTENEANAGFSMASGVLGLLDFRFTLRLTQDLNHHVRARLFERIQALPFTAFDDERIGDAVYRVMYDTPAITNGVYRILLTPVGALVLAAVTIAVLEEVFGAHPAIVACAAGLLVVALVATFPFAAALRRRSLRSRQAGAGATSTLEEGLTNMLAVQSLGGEARERERFDARLLALLQPLPRPGGPRHAGVARGTRAGLRHRRLRVLLRGGPRDPRAHLPGDFGLLFSYFLVLAFACVEVGALWLRLQGSAAGLDRVFFLMDLPWRSTRRAPAPSRPLREAVRLEGVGYRYPDGTEALADTSLELGVGRVVALVGPAGAGKTTLASCIPRFLAPTSGRVLFDGVDVARATLASVRGQVAFVFQETVLFDGSVEENLRLGRPDATDAELRRAAEIAGADEFVRAPSRGLRHAPRARRRKALGRPEAAPRDRAGAAPALAGPHPRRADLGPRPRDRAAPRRGAPRGEPRPRGARRSPTASRPFAPRTRSSSSTAGASWSAAATRSSCARSGGAYRRFVELQAAHAA